MMFPPGKEGEYLAHEEWRAYLHSMYVKQGVARSPRLVPFAKALPPLGTWRLDDCRRSYGREIAVLVSVDPWRLVGTESDSMGRLCPDLCPDADRYCEWMLQGLAPPPVEVLETADGKLKLLDGHRRQMGALKAGRTLLAWVSPTVNADPGSRHIEEDPTHWGLTFEMWRDRGSAAFEGSVFLAALLGQELRIEPAPGL